MWLIILMPKRTAGISLEEERAVPDLPRRTEETLPLHPEYEWKQWRRQVFMNRNPGVTKLPQTLFPPGWETWDPVVGEVDGHTQELALDRFPKGTFHQEEDSPAYVRDPKWEQEFRRLNAEVLVELECSEEKEEAYFGAPGRYFPQMVGGDDKAMML